MIRVALDRYEIIEIDTEFNLDGLMETTDPKWIAFKDNNGKVWVFNTDRIIYINAD
jgi:hypothetical protein